MEILYPDYFEPKPYQLDAVKWALKHRKSYLALDPGLGKTAVAAMIYNTLNQPFLYICPPFLQWNVLEEFEQLTDRKITLLWTPKGRVFKFKNILGDSILGREEIQERIRNFVTAAKKKGFDPILFVDEQHRFKTLSAQRSKALYKIEKLFGRTVLMSGSPMPNRPLELYSVLKHVRPDIIGHRNKVEFGKKYCAPKLVSFYVGGKKKKAWDFKGANRETFKGLAQRMKKDFMLRVTDEVLNLDVKQSLLFIGDKTPVEAKID